MTRLSTLIANNRTPMRAERAWFRLNDKEATPTQVAFKNVAGTTLAAQTVRIEYDSSASESEAASGVAARRKLVIFGIRDHATLPDTDIKKGYRFVRENREYQVVSVIVTLGEIQAIAEIVS